MQMHVFEIMQMQTQVSEMIQMLNASVSDDSNANARASVSDHSDGVNLDSKVM